MKYMKYIIIILFVFISCGNNPDIKDKIDISQDTDSLKNKNQTYQDINISLRDELYTVRYLVEPVTSEYLSGIINSSIAYSTIHFIYAQISDPGQPDIMELALEINNRNTFNLACDMRLDQTISGTQFYDSFLHDLEQNVAFSMEIPTNRFLNILQIIYDQRDYYLNAAEYHGETSRLIALPRGFEHKSCYIYLEIEAPDFDPNEDPPCYALCKSWNPGENPPAELSDLIDYLEDVIIPEIRQHPYP